MTDSAQESAALLPSSAPASGRIPLRIYIVSVGFTVLFLAYNSLQNYVTSLLPHGLGNQSLAVLYISVCAFVFLAPPLVRKLGEKWTMVLGGGCYVVYMASLIKIVRPVVLAAAVVIGFGAAILWVAVGAYITKSSLVADLGRNNGVFWGIFQLSNVLGNLFAYFIFAKLGGGAALFTAFTVAGAVGTLLLVFVPRLSNVPHSDASAARNLVEIALSPWQEFKATVSIMFTFNCVALTYMFIFTGLELAFWTGEFPQLLTQKSIGIVLTFAGAGEVFGAVVLSRLSDKVGCTAMAVLGACVYGAGLGLTCWLRHTGLPGPRPLMLDNSWVAYTAACCFGIGDSVLNTQIYALLGKLYKGQVMVRSFTVFQLFQNLGSAGGFYYSLILPMHGSHGSLGQVWVQLFLLVFGTLFFAWADIRQAWRRQAKAKDGGLSVNQ